MAAGANSPGTLKWFFQFIFRIWNLDFAAGDYSSGTSTVMSFDIRQKKGQNRGVEWSKLTLSKCAVEGLNCHEVDNFEF